VHFDEVKLPENSISMRDTDDESLLLLLQSQVHRFVAASSTFFFDSFKDDSSIAGPLVVLVNNAPSSAVMRPLPIADLALCTTGFGLASEIIGVPSSTSRSKFLIVRTNDSSFDETNLSRSS
jgi:hypothetical protein